MFVPLDALQHLENGLDLGLADDWAIWRVAITRLAARLVGLRNGLHLAIHHDGDKALAAVQAQEVRSSRHLHAECLGEGEVWVSEHGKERALRLLIDRPGVHGSTVVGTKDDDTIHVSVHQILLLCQKARHLHPGSARREGAWKAQEDELSRGQHFLDVDLLAASRDEAVVQHAVWDLISDLDRHGERKAGSEDDEARS